MEGGKRAGDDDKSGAGALFMGLFALAMAPVSWMVLSNMEFENAHGRITSRGISLLYSAGGKTLVASACLVVGIGLTVWGAKKALAYYREKHAK